MVRVKFEGGPELVRALESLSTRVSKRVMREALESAGEPIRLAMQQKAPREPGAPDLADNMVIGNARVEGLLDDSQTAAVAIGPSKGFFYAFFQEFGTVHHPAQPFARPAFDEGVARAIRDIAASMWTALAAKGISRSVVKNTPVESDGPLL